jgi:hypothetical protein
VLFNANYGTHFITPLRSSFPFIRLIQKLNEFK